MTDLRLFGTDGIRGAFGRPPIDAATITAVGRHLGHRADDDRPRKVVIGGDTRESTETVAGWLHQGLSSTGATVLWAGVVPTPAVAHLCRRLAADVGISVSASHNPWPDNGVKIVGADGFKWSDDEEGRLASAVAGDTHTLAGSRPMPTPDPKLAEDYLSALSGSLPAESSLAGVRVAVDSANGAASPFARRLFEGLGATVTSAFDDPDGRNINVDCGSTHPQAIRRLTRACGADVGVSLDGDADRLILADETGAILDGDAILYLWARALAEQGELEPRTLVVTQMSNLGLDAALAADGIETVRCDIGDRAVVAMMREQGILLGGEQSGHLVHLGLGTSGDGLLSALQVIALHRGRSLREAASGFRPFPQVLRNVRVTHKPPFDTLRGVQATVESIRHELGDQGRVLLRYSGTEPLARVMIEGRDPERIATLADRCAALLADQLG